MSKFSYWINPKFWGLSGKYKERALIEYESKSEKELDFKLLEIDYINGTKDYEIQKIKLLLKHNIITSYEADLKLLELKYPNKDYKEFKKELTELQLSHNIISERDYEFLMLDNYYSPESKKYKLKLLDLKMKFNEINQLEYELAKIDLEYYNHDSNDYKMNKYDILLKHEKITQEEYDYNILDLYDNSSTDYKIKKIDLDLKYGKINDEQYEKEKATIKGEEYFKMTRGEYIDGQIEFEFDWNDVFIKNLRENGFKGDTDADVANMWFNDVCKQIYLSSGDVSITEEEIDTYRNNVEHDGEYAIYS